MKSDESRSELLKGMLSIMNPKLYIEIYGEEQGLEEDEGEAIEVDEFGDIDSFLSRIDGARKVEERQLYTDWM